MPDLRRAALDLARFISALQRIDPAGGPHPGEHNSWRGVPLFIRDASVRQSIAALDGMLDAEAATAAWEASLDAPGWDRPPVWIHGDLQPGNLLARDGRICAVIDFGCLGVADPACDLRAGLELSGCGGAAGIALDAGGRRCNLGGRGWALSVALIALPYYLHTNPAIVAASWRVLDEVLADGDRNA